MRSQTSINVAQRALYLHNSYYPLIDHEDDTDGRTR